MILRCFHRCLIIFHQVNAALVDAGVCAMIVNKALWDWPCILPDTTIDKACTAAQDAVLNPRFPAIFCM